MSTLGFTNVYNIGGFFANPGLREVFPTENVPELEQARLRLQALINRTESYLDNETFTTTSQTALKAAREKALLVLGSDNIDAINDAYQELQAAFNGLVLIAELEAAREDLQKLINRINELDESDFTPQSWTLLQEALRIALAALESEDIDAINAAFEGLYVAFNELEALQPEPENGPNLPAAGQNSTIAAFAGGLLLALGLVIALKDQKKFE